MNKQILDILIPKLESKWVTVLVDIDNFEEIRLKLPTKPGIYEIRTTAPISVLSKLPVENKRIDAAHCNFREKIKNSKTLESLYIQEDVINGYVVYTGHQKSIRQRCKEHFKGSQGTGCLHFFEFEELREYDWWFDYLEVKHFEGFEDSNLFRTYLEQLHRANIGWPILCSQ